SDTVQQDKAAENSEVKEDEDLEVEEEVQRLIHEEEKQKKKRLKRVRKAKMKLAERLVLKMEHQGDHIEQVDDELFSLSTLHDFVGLEEARKLIGDTSMTGADDMARDEMKKALKEIRNRREEERRSAVEGGTKVHFSKRGDDADKPDYDSQQTSGNTYRDDLYLSSDEEDEGIENDGDTQEDENESDAEDVDLDLYSEEEDDAELRGPNSKRARFAEPITRPSESKRTSLPHMDGFNAIAKPRNPLLVDLDDAPEKIKQKRKIESWLDSEEMKDLLAPVEEDDRISTTSSDSDEPTEKQKTKGKKKKKAAVVETGSPADIKRQPGVVSKGSAEESATKTNESNVPTVTEHSVQRLKRLRRPLTPEERALALRLIRSAKSRRELLESAYHRMQFFEDPSDLPDWFVEDERIHMRKPLPLTKEEVSQDRPTQGRSMTKVEEAKARKKARLAKRLKRIRKKAEEISDDVPEAEKWQQIKQMYKKAGLLNKKRRPLHLIVNTKGGARNKTTKAPRGAKVKIVDRRMKADLRARDRGASKRRQRGGRTGRPVRLLAHKPRRGG
ncbi:Spb1 protein, partial [Opisthorchis viverrini]